MSRLPIQAWSEKFGQATLLLAWVSGVCLFFMLAVISAGVIMRYAFGQPMLGTNEIVKLTAVAFVMSALPYCTARGGHVSVDVFDQAIGRRGRLFGDILSRVLSSFALAVLCWRAALKALDAFEYTDTTNMLSLPVWPFYAILAAGTGLCALICSVEILALLSGGKRR